MAAASPTRRTQREKRAPAGTGLPRRGRGARISPREPKEGQGGLALRKAPRQHRSRELLEMILKAAALTFAELGYARATTNRIAERAGVSVGSLYQYFSSKDALLARLLADHHAQMHAIITPAVARLADPEVPLEGTIRALFGALVAVHEANPAIARALSEAVLRQSSAIEGAWSEEDEASQAAVLAEALAGRPDVRRGDFRAMAAVLARTTGQLTRWLVHDAPPGLERAVLLEETVQLVARYLAQPRARGDARPASHPAGRVRREGPS